jgi:hypothetical protein
MSSIDAAGIQTLANQWGLNPGRVNQLEDLANQFEQISGYQAKVPDWMLQEMGTNNNYGNIGHQINSLYDFGQYMQSHVNPSGAAGGAYAFGSDATKTMPWAFVGLNATEYNARVSSYQTVYKNLIGRDATDAELTQAFSGGAGQGSGGGLLSASELDSKLKNDTTLQQTYGWLKFGMNYTEFQKQKADFRTQFGTQLTDEQAVQQLTYDHALGHVLGAYQTAQLAPQNSQQMQSGQPNNAVGIGQSEAR